MLAVKVHRASIPRYVVGRWLAAILSMIGWVWLFGSLFAAGYTFVNKIPGGGQSLIYIVFALCILVLCHVARAVFDTADSIRKR